MRARLWAFAALAGLLAACTSGVADPTPSPTPVTMPATGSSAVSAVVSSTPAPPSTGPVTTGPNLRPGDKPPVFPALARKHTAAGALAFAAYFFASYDWGYATNNPAPVAAISESTCQGCNKYIEGLREVQRAGAVLTGGRITVVSRGLRTGRFNYQAERVVRVVVNETPIVVTRPGHVGSTVAPAVHNHASYLFVSWRAGAWTASELASR